MLFLLEKIHDIQKLIKFKEKLIKLIVYNIPPIKIFVDPA